MGICCTASVSASLRRDMERGARTAQRAVPAILGKLSHLWKFLEIAVSGTPGFILACFCFGALGLSVFCCWVNNIRRVNAKE